MGARRVWLGFLATVTVIVWTALAVRLLSRANIIPADVPIQILDGILVLVGGVFAVSVLGNSIRGAMLPTMPKRAYTISSIVRFVGYVVVGIVALALFGVGPEAALAGGTFSGLVVGLAAQPVLSNFFAGIVVLVGRYVEPGDEIRLASSELPYGLVAFPAYKYFSPDYVYTGYRGRVVDIGLLYTTMITDTGLELRVPNRTILNSAIVDYRPSYSHERLYQVRYEFNVNHEPKVVLEKIRKAVSDVGDIQNILLNEQSDKEFYIVLIEFKSAIADDWKATKSEILRKLIEVHRGLKG